MGRVLSTFDAHHVRQTFGVTFPLTPALREKVGKAILVVAGADGALSDTEMDYFLGLARTWGASDAQLEAFQKFDYRAARLADLLDAETRPLARIILYEAVRIARSDGFAANEREAAARAAKMLGLDAHIVVDIEALLGIEDAVRAARIRLLSPVE